MRSALSLSDFRIQKDSLLEFYSSDPLKLAIVKSMTYKGGRIWMSTSLFILACRKDPTISHWANKSIDVINRLLGEAAYEQTNAAIEAEREARSEVNPSP